MSWIESHQELRNHPKTRKAARLAGITRRDLVGALHFLWWWALDYAQSGDLTSFDTAELEAEMEWEGEPGGLLRALTECGQGGGPGFLERKTDGHLLIHDWWDYAGKLIEKRAIDRDRKRAGRLLAVRGTSDGHPMDVAGRGQTDKTEQTIQTDQEWATANALFQDNISLVSSSILPDMLDIWATLESGGCTGWWAQAVTIAVARNKRSWDYVRGILQKCLNEGHPPQNNGTGKKPGLHREVKQISYGGQVQDVS